ncbi:hypothetical protein PTQ19_12080 [Microbacterium esteraromaticum]|uniref:hypothetical protein n=1 Tax=Microbacterium esteraromaticum TaxID=57043 RepID=UPI0023677348|nr:hypothetical protein [Microbacterium esteraromaticum]WDH78249.1 hypothetical protein PTQ19_12080 [Microbacterium esteraromaticum]
MSIDKTMTAHEEDLDREQAEFQSEVNSQGGRSFTDRDAAERELQKQRKKQEREREEGDDLDEAHQIALDEAHRQRRERENPGEAADNARRREADEAFAATLAPRSTDRDRCR